MTATRALTIVCLNMVPVHQPAWHGMRDWPVLSSYCCLGSCRIPKKENEKHDEVQSVSTSGTRDQSDNHVARIGNMISRFRAAGVQAYVDKAMDAWILGESIIRSETSQEGEGIDYHSTRLRHINADMIVS